MLAAVVMAIALFARAVVAGVAIEPAKGLQHTSASALAVLYEHWSSGKTDVAYATGTNFVPSNVGTNRVTSVYVKEGYRVRLWEKSGRSGDRIMVHPGWNDLHRLEYMNDNTDSFDVEELPPCTIYQHNRGAGYNFDAKEVNKMYTSSELKDYTGANMNDAASSVYVAPGYKCTLYKDNNGAGTSMTYYEGMHYDSELSYHGLNDRVSSMKVQTTSTGYLEYSSSSSAKAIAWEHFANGKKVVYTNIGTNQGMGDVGANKVTSVWVQEGYRVRLWEKSGRSGARIMLHPGWNNLPEIDYMNDHASCVDVETLPPCTIYERNEGGGYNFDATVVNKMYKASELKDYTGNSMNDRVSSVYVASGYKCTLYKDDNGAGTSMTFYPGLHWSKELDWLGLADRVSSMIVNFIFAPPPPSPPPSPPPPSPPPPSPPPPSPPPPGSHEEVQVIISNAPALVSSYSFGFGITVRHGSCSPVDDCFQTIGASDVGKQSSGLRCEVRVQKTDDTCASGFGDHLPCRQWDDFYPKTLEMTDANGALKEGTYDIKYSCYFELSNGSRVPQPTGSWKTLHSFRISNGCDETLSFGSSSKLENVVRQLLLTADEFNVADCRDRVQVYKAKEAVFRRHDNAPTDGVLSYEEIASALSKQSADSYIVSLWQSALGGKLELTMSQVMSTKISDVDPCGSGSVVFESAVYPTNSPGRETNPTQCAANATAMRVAWRYDAKLTAGDFACVYIDGLLYDKLSVSSSNPGSSEYTLVGDLYAPTELTDIRPISGTFEDIQQSLVANFLFDDGDDAQLITSASPLVSGQVGPQPTLTPTGTARTLSACSGGDGALCMRSVSNPTSGSTYAYKYNGQNAFSDDIAVTAWMYSSCANRAGSDVKAKSIAYFSGTSGGVFQELRFYLNQVSSALELHVDYVKAAVVMDNLSIGGIACNKWHYVGFSLNKLDKLVLFVNPTGDVTDVDDANYKAASDMAADVPRKVLSSMSEFLLLGAVDVEFDDVRVYSGQVTRATFLDAYRCGHRPLCARRAHATPSSRRVVCASAVISDKASSTYSDSFCTAAMYYDGSAVDVLALLDPTGVTFTFRDTSWEEISFEVLRKSAGESAAAVSYETIIQMDGDLKGCVNKFSSITYIDRDAGNKPNLEWYYKVRTKLAAGAGDFVSTAHFFRAPWIGTIVGAVQAGQSSTTVPNVRVCADFVMNGTLMSSQSSTTSATRNVALYMRAQHTSDVTRTALQDTYVVTDGDSSGGSTVVNAQEYLRVELAQWSSVENIEVCVSGSTTNAGLRAFVQDYDSGDDHGHECELKSNSVVADTAHSCFVYECRGTHLKTFHGRYITAASSAPKSSLSDARKNLPLDGLHAWFESRNTGALWPSSVGSLVGTVVGGTVSTRVEGGHGAFEPLRALYGDKTAKFDFGLALPGNTWTLCTLSRYAGNTRSRIFQATGNFLHGHWSGRRGVAHYDGWVTANSNRGVVDDWLVMCGTNMGKRVYVDGANVATGDRNGASGNKYLGINYAKGTSNGANEVSDWAVAEVMTWTRALSDAEMLRATEYLNSLLRDPKVYVTEIIAKGVATRCSFSAVSDANGQYEISLKDTSGLVPVTATVAVGAYKEDVFRKTNETLIDSSLTDSQHQPQNVLLVVRDLKTNSASERNALKADEFATLTSYDSDGSDSLSMDEFEYFLRTIAGYPTNGRVVVSADAWEFFDRDADGALSVDEFNVVVAYVNAKKFVADAFLSYPVVDTSYLSGFVTTRGGTGKPCQAFLLARRSVTTAPSNASAWSSFYAESLAPYSDVLKTQCSSNEIISCAVVGGNETMTKALPLLVTGKSVSLSLKNQPNTASLYETFVSSATSLGAIKQYYDIIHEFDKSELSESDDSQHENHLTFSANTTMKVSTLIVKHRSEGLKDIADDTVAIVRGAVLFPKDWTAGSTTCGLFEANIEVSEVGAEGEPQKYTTDEAGWFEIALTRGKSFVFKATFPKHTICYTGKTIADASDAVNCDGSPQTVTLSQLGDGNYLFFTDVTRGNIDLGVYQGQCEKLYSGAKFKITPINGCHAPVYVDSAAIGGWMANVVGLPEGKFTSTDPLPQNARVWPFAAMDYSIMLDSGPSVGGIGDLIAGETWKDGCATEDGDMVTFFRRRNALERLALMRDESDWQTIRYKYHGYICVDIPDAYIPKISVDDEVCYDPAEPAGGLTLKHFLGESSVLSTVSASKHIQMKVFELHVSNGAYDKCFTALPDEDKGTGSTKVKIRQDVSNAEDTECHPDRGGGESCDFQVVLDNDGYVTFPGGDSELVITAGQPNLAGNHRRTVRVEVERNDLYRSVTAIAIRELIPLGSKPRGGEGLSDGTFWATVPLDGLVYTVVHDPPGGNSYAELMSGTQVKMEWALASTRALTIKGGTYVEGKGGHHVNTEFAISAGWVAEAEMKGLELDIKILGEGAEEVDGPNFSATSESKAGWDLTMTTDRTIRSSQDPALPGRAGDAIMGGGIELAYTLSDILDLSRSDGAKNCLDVQSSITWLPRKPTTYVLTTHTIEATVVPNLKFLLATVQSGGVDAESDNSGKPTDVSWKEYLSGKIASWERTLNWASPIDASNIAVALTGAESIYGRNLETKLNDNGGWGYNELFTRDADYSTAATDLANEWAAAIGIDLGSNAPLLAAGVAFFPIVPVLLIQPALFTVGAYVQEARLLPYMQRAGDDNPVQGPRGSDAGRLPYATGSIIHPIARDRDIRPNYDSVFKDESGEVFYSFGMNDYASADMDDSSEDFTGTEGSVGEGAQTLRPTETKRVIASLTGGSGPIGMDIGDDTNPSEQQILLSFSGGGHSLDFTFTSNEAITEYLSHVTFAIEGEVSFKAGAELDYDLVPGVLFETHTGAKFGWSRNHEHDRMFVWNKYGHLTTTYSLGDSQYGDKFVVSVASDARFGTPVFVTKGGRSACPAELGTVFRESGVSLEVPLATKMNTENMNPGQRAIFEVVIKNESPYREEGAFALRLVDGLAASLREIVSAAYDEASATSSDANSVKDHIDSVTAKTIAKDSPDVARVTSAAATAAAASGSTAKSVADAVFSAASTAPRDAFELGDSVFMINGNRLSIGDYVPFKFVGGDSLDRQKFISQQYLNFAVTPGYATRNIKYLQLRLQSLCELQLWEDGNLYRDPISYTQNMDAMSWSQPCPKVQFDESTMAKYLFSSQSPSSSSELSLTVNNPDQYVLWPDADVTDSLMNERLQLVRLQYRPVSGGEWITAKDEGSSESDKKFNLLCADSRTEGCKFDWKINNQYEKLLSGFKDDVYELRVKSFCFGGPALAEASVHEYVGDQRLTLKVDTKPPVAIRKLDFSSASFGVEFEEAIDCTKQSVKVTKTRSACSSGTVMNKVVSSEELESFLFKCTNSEIGGLWLILFPQNTGGTYRIDVTGVTDTAGNAAENFSLNVDARCSAAPSTTANLGAHRTADAPTALPNMRFMAPRKAFALATALGFAAIVTVAARLARRSPGDERHESARLIKTTPVSYSAVI